VTKTAQSIVSFDSMTLVWGIRKKGSPEAVQRAKYLFAQLESEEAQIILPSIVIAEFVTPLPSPREREEVVAAMRERFLIAPFDAKDAIRAAKLWNDGKDRRQMRKHGARVCLRADALIVATACNHGARVFYTEDKDCFRMAETVMVAKHLPTIAPHLYTDTEEA